MQNRIYVVIFIGRWVPCTTAVFCFNAIEGFCSCCNNIAIISGSRECIVRWPKGELPVLRGYDPVDNKVVLVYCRINPVGTAGILRNVELLQVRICLFVFVSPWCVKCTAWGITHFTRLGALWKDDDRLRRGWDPLWVGMSTGSITKISAIRYGCNVVFGHDKDLSIDCWGNITPAHSPFILWDWLLFRSSPRRRQGQYWRVNRSMHIA